MWGFCLFKKICYVKKTLDRRVQLKLKELKIIGIETLTKYGVEDASTKVNLLLQYILKLNKIELVIKAEEVINEEQKESFFKYLEELKNGKPIQYITNSQEFMGLNFYVDENVLIPQPDTEILVENTINVVKKLMKDKEFISKKVNPSDLEHDTSKENSIIKILDLCTGSGAIGVSIEDYIFNKNETKEIVEIYASDVSKKALEIAKKNAIANNKNSKINFILSDMFDEITTKDFDIIVSNPPYIETQTIGRLSEEVQNEPILALNAGKDGLEY